MAGKKIENAKHRSKLYGSKQRSMADYRPLNKYANFVTNLMSIVFTTKIYMHLFIRMSVNTV